MSESRQIEGENKTVVQRAFDNWAAGTGGVFDLLADDATWTIVGNSPVSRTFTSREFLDTVVGPFNARLSTPFVPSVRALYADGDVVIAYFEASATANDGKPYFNTYTYYLTMRDGKIVEGVAFLDTIAFTDFWTRVAPAG